MSEYSKDTGVVKTFSTWDYVLFAITLVVSAGIGVVFAIRDRKKHTTKDFLLGGRKMSVVPVALSLSVTFMSALTLLGNPAEIYNYHTMFWWLVGAFIIAMVFAAQVFIPFFYNLGIMSTFEYLQMRFGKAVRICSCCVLITQTLIYMAFLLYAPSLALNAVTGLDLWGSVIGMGVVVTFYTTLGGMKAVLWTDTFQAFVIFAGLLAVIIKGSIVEGGFDKAWEKADKNGRVVFDDFSVDPKTRHSVWSMVIGGWAFWSYLYGINQAQVQRCLSVPSVKKARLAIYVNLPSLAAIVSLACMIGILLIAFYEMCDPKGFNLITKTDQLVPLYVMDILGDYPGVPGIFVSCVISGSLSSLSSGLNALSAVTLKDILHQTCMTKKLSDKKETMLSKGLVFFYGVLAIGLAWVVSKLGNVLQAVYIVFGILNGPLLGVFTLGMWFPWANRRGALVGMFFSLGFLLWVGIAGYVEDIKTPMSSTNTSGCAWHINSTPAPLTLNTTNPVSEPEESDDLLHDLYRMSYMWYTALGMVLTWAVGMLVSLCTGFTKPSTLDPRLICPLVETLCPCLPKKVLKFFRFGIDHDDKYDKYGDEKTKPSADINKGKDNIYLAYEESNGKADGQSYGQNDFQLGRQYSQNEKSKDGQQNLGYVADSTADTKL